MSSQGNNSCANYAASVSRMCGAALVFRPLSSEIRCLSDTAGILDSEQTPRHISKDTFLSFIRTAYPSVPSDAYINFSIRLQSFNPSLVELFIVQARKCASIVHRGHLGTLTNGFCSFQFIQYSNTGHVFVIYVTLNERHIQHELIVRNRKKERTLERCRVIHMDLVTKCLPLS